MTTFDKASEAFQVIALAHSAWGEARRGRAPDHVPDTEKVDEALSTLDGYFDQPELLDGLSRAVTFVRELRRRAGGWYEPQEDAGMRVSLDPGLLFTEQGGKPVALTVRVRVTRDYSFSDDEVRLVLMLAEDLDGAPTFSSEQHDEHRHRPYIEVMFGGAF